MMMRSVSLVRCVCLASLALVALSEVPVRVGSLQIFTMNLGEPQRVQEADDGAPVCLGDQECALYDAFACTSLDGPECVLSRRKQSGLGADGTPLAKLLSNMLKGIKIKGGPGLTIRRNPDGSTTITSKPAQEKLDTSRAKVYSANDDNTAASATTTSTSSAAASTAASTASAVGAVENEDDPISSAIEQAVKEVVGDLGLEPLAGEDSDSAEAEKKELWRPSPDEQREREEHEKFLREVEQEEEEEEQRQRQPQHEEEEQEEQEEGDNNNSDIDEDDAAINDIQWFSLDEDDEVNDHGGIPSLEAMVAENPALAEALAHGGQVQFKVKAFRMNDDGSLEPVDDDPLASKMQDKLTASTLEQVQKRLTSSADAADDEEADLAAQQQQQQIQAEEEEEEEDESDLAAPPQQQQQPEQKQPEAEEQAEEQQQEQEQEEQDEEEEQEEDDNTQRIDRYGDEVEKQDVIVNGETRQKVKMRTTVPMPENATPEQLHELAMQVAKQQMQDMLRRAAAEGDDSVMQEYELMKLKVRLFDATGKQHVIEVQPGAAIAAERAAAAQPRTVAATLPAENQKNKKKKQQTQQRAI
eukprot:TRINITY_DN66192_c5_g2_i1.p1 TRINITY_DN66192_c5_g2~~TRINITY_DN66192_c5_g2_i1.p1  ORF type:complete len:585 (-),score=296.41 TRINITY_DN66192_c5_g2_i1:990-2744(-)